MIGSVSLLAIMFGLTLELQHHRDAVFTARVRDAERTVDILRHAIAADGRFRDVSVSMTTGPHVFMIGTVACRDDWDALRRLVERTPTPFHANLAVRLDTNSPNEQR